MNGVPPSDHIQQAFDDLLADTPAAQPAWAAFARLMRERYGEFSAALGRNIPEADLVPLLSVLLIPILRNAFVTAERSAALFDAAQAMGAHLLPVHFYSPVPDTSGLAESLFAKRFDALPGWDWNTVAQLELLARLGEWREELADVPWDAPAGRFAWRNPAFIEADAAVYYSMIRQFRPRRVLEVGGGYSTMIAAKAALANGATILDTIEPYPMQPLVDGFPGFHRLIRKPIQDVHRDEITSLGENDILFIDSTHVLKIGSDLHHLFFSVLPYVQKGVLIHFHDIWLPFEYPRSWPMERHIFWNEQYLLLAFLLFNSAFEVLLSTQYLGKIHRSALAAAYPFLERLGGGSFWIRRREPPGDSR